MTKDRAGSHFARQNFAIGPPPYCADIGALLNMGGCAKGSHSGGAGL
jgi:hypothetical protein